MKKEKNKEYSVTTFVIGIIFGTIFLLNSLFSVKPQLAPGENFIDLSLGLGVGLLITGLIAGFFVIRKEKNS